MWMTSHLDGLKDTFYILYLYAFICFQLSLYNPESVILDYLGPLGRLVRYLHNNNLKLLYQM